MSEHEDDAPRPPAGDVPPLAQMPLVESGLSALEVLRVDLPGLAAGIEAQLWRPTVRGNLARAAVPTLAREPKLSPLTEEHVRDPRPRFEFDGTCLRIQISLGSGTRLYGGGLATGGLLRNGRTIELWNRDAYRYDENTTGLYQSHPYVLALDAQGRALGILADTPRRGTLALAADGLELQLSDGGADLYLLHAPDPAGVQRALGSLVGHAPLPPLWSLGYHQCRWSYMSTEEVVSIANEFRERRIPCDGLWLDIDALDRQRSFTWDPERYAGASDAFAALRTRGFHMVAITGPGLAADHGYEPTREALEQGHFVLSPAPAPGDSDGDSESDGEHEAAAPVSGRVWPGPCHFPDFTREQTRAWWAERIARYARDSHLDGIWNDMNEPALFRTPTGTLPLDARHRGMGGGDHAAFHNLYGQLMAQATRDGLERAYPQRRAFVLSRSLHVAGARFAATWTGDNQARWEDLRWSIPMVLGLGLSGQPFAGPDLGGFEGDPSPELFERWFELGAYLPFARGHSVRGAIRKEPWSFGPEVEARVRASLERRMRLLGVLYTLFREAEASGLPVVRPVFFADPADAELAAIDDAFLLGRDLLVAPIVHAGERERRVLLPTNQQWYRFSDLQADGLAQRPETGWTDVAAPLGTTPIFARAGAVLPLSPVRPHTTSGVHEQLELHVFLDSEGGARGELYEDAGDGHAYRTDGLFRHVRWRALTQGGELHLRSEFEGDLELQPRRRRLVVHDTVGTRVFEDIECEHAHWELSGT